MHVFPYSPRAGTSAAHIKDQVPDGEKRARTGEMLALAAEAHERFRRAQLGKTASVLWETSHHDPSNPAGDAIWSGLTGNYLRVRTSASQDLTNTITDAKLAAQEDGWVTALVE
jgi:threonylcarbamoyladenosine tRNA methylthiotransferase MtaB